jgi:hypothetical protein
VSGQDQTRKSGNNGPEDSAQPLYFPNPPSRHKWCGGVPLHLDTSCVDAGLDLNLIVFQCFLFQRGSALEQMPNRHMLILSLSRALEIVPSSEPERPTAAYLLRSIQWPPLLARIVWE